MTLGVRTSIKHLRTSIVSKKEELGLCADKIAVETSLFSQLLEDCQWPPDFVLSSEFTSRDFLPQQKNLGRTALLPSFY